MKKIIRIVFSSVLTLFILAFAFFLFASSDTRNNVIIKNIVSSVSDKFNTILLNAEKDMEQFRTHKNIAKISDNVITYLNEGMTSVSTKLGQYKCVVDVKDSKKINNIKYINQNKVGLPTGCESVSTVMALKYLGVKITADEFVDEYLKKSEDMFEFNPYKEFGGDPRTEYEGLGCYNTAIESAVNELIEKKNLKLKVTSLNDVSIGEICRKYINKNIPVVFWATNGMKLPQESCSIWYNNEEHKWISPCHCLLLVGYDKDNYIFHDPLVDAYTRYPKSEVRKAYKGMLSQALVIEKV